MKINNLITPFLSIGLSIAFVIVVIGVYLTRGKSKFWISKKMLFGSLLLSLTSVTNQSCGIIGTNCYDPAPPNQINIDNLGYSGTVEINIKTNNKLTGILYDRIGNDFSFNITDTLNSDTLQVGNIYPTDGKFDESSEDIFLELDGRLPIDEYILNLYNTKQSEQNHPIMTYRLKIKNED